MEIWWDLPCTMPQLFQWPCDIWVFQAILASVSRSIFQITHFFVHFLLAPQRVLEILLKIGFWKSLQLPCLPSIVQISEVNWILPLSGIHFFGDRKWSQGNLLVTNPWNTCQRKTETSRQRSLNHPQDIHPFCGTVARKMTLAYPHQDVSRCWIQTRQHFSTWNTRWCLNWGFWTFIFFEHMVVANCAPFWHDFFDIIDKIIHYIYIIYIYIKIWKHVIYP